MEPLEVIVKTSDFVKQNKEVVLIIAAVALPALYVGYGGAGYCFSAIKSRVNRIIDELDDHYRKQDDIYSKSDITPRSLDPSESQWPY